MENQNYPAWKHAINYGIYIGIALIIVDLLFYVLDLYLSNWKGYITYVVILIGVVTAAISYRDKHLNGFITFGQSFLVGFYAALFAAILFLIYFILLLFFTGEEIPTMMLQKAEEDAIRKRPDMSDEELEMTMKFAGYLLTPFGLTIIAFFGTLFFGTVFSLIASIFIKKENKSLEVEQQ